MPHSDLHWINIPLSWVDFYFISAVPWACTLSVTCHQSPFPRKFEKSLNSTVISWLYPKHKPSPHSTQVCVIDLLSCGKCPVINRCHVRLIKCINTKSLCLSSSEIPTFIPDLTELELMARVCAAASGSKFHSSRFLKNILLSWEAFLHISF